MNTSGAVKSFMKLRFPRALRRTSRAAVFSEIHRTNAWRDPESVSGRGSTLARTKVITSQLPVLLQELNADSLIDAACGDFNWMRYTELSAISYTGVDVVPDLISSNRRLYETPHRRFLVLDITKDRLPRADAILCRDCLIHLCFTRIQTTIANFKRSGAIYLLCTTHDGLQENNDCPDGSWRSVNLELSPFNFPPPLKQIVEDQELRKCLGVWQLRDL